MTRISSASPRRIAASADSPDSIWPPIASNFPGYKRIVSDR
jgi:hypothetical protein